MGSQAVADVLERSGQKIPGTEWSFRLGGKPIQPDANLIDGHRVDGKTIDVLLTLAAAAPHPVPATVLMNKVWPNVVVGDNVVHQAMTNIRKALKDDVRKPLFVETVPRKGYRLVADIEWPDDTVVVAEPQHRSRKLAYAMIAFLAIGSLLGAAYVGVPSILNQPIELKLTVMPFVPVGVNQQQRYVSQSIYDEVVANLSNRDTITLVGSRASLAEITDEKLPLMIKRLGITHILEGSTRIVDGDKVRINLRLLNAEQETHVWSGSYELATRGNFERTLADRVGNAVAAAMEGRESDDIDAYDPFARP
ncbi:MAG: winged helix-turn-helix domain-containing protein [Gammaproteobacteria bacterium]|nr:winged helix-turn-helix domain-containing protein [Gammaproteobacteria bacterium]